MQKQIIVVLLMLISKPVLSMDTRISIGSGTQYAGAFGGQLILNQGQHSVRSALGFLGIGFGYDYMIIDKASIGLSYTHNNFFHEATLLNLNYYPSGKRIEGFMIGLDIGRGIKSFSNDEDKSTVFGVSFGYSFH